MMIILDSGVRQTHLLFCILPSHRYSKDYEQRKVKSLQQCLKHSQCLT